MASQVLQHNRDVAFFKDFKGPKKTVRTPLAKESEKRKADRWAHENPAEARERGILA